MAAQIFVTGGSGFVGSAVIEQLLARSSQVHALVHRRPLPQRANLTNYSGELFDQQALDRAMARCDAVIHLVGIIMEKPAEGVTFQRMHYEATASVLEAAKRNGIKRYVHMSALGTRADAPSMYHRTKFMAEEAVRGSGLDWTIIRPSMIHGPKGEFMAMEAKWARGKAPPYLFMPYFGAGLLGLGGAGLLQPVFVEDVARAFVDALEKPGTIGEVYPLGGPDQMTWPALHAAVSRAVVGKRRAVLAIPVWKAKLLTRLLPAGWLPFNRDQVLMSQEDNTCDLTKFCAGFGWEPQSFEATLRDYAKEL